MATARPRRTTAAAWGWLLTSTLLLSSAPSWALGLGDPRAQVVLGQPLNLAVPVSLADGETLGGECADAEVTAGDSRLPVRVRITQGRDAGEAVIRITSSAVVEEPVLQVAVRAGCPPRITRTLTLFADPPTVAPIIGVPATTPASPVTSPAPVAAAPTPAPSARATRPATPARSTARSAPRAVAPAAEPQATAAAPAPRPRLQLDAGQVARGNVAPAASAALATDAAASAAVPDAAAVAVAEAASAAQQRLSEVEAELARVRAEAKAQTEAMVALRKQLALDQAQRERQALVMPLLMIALAVVALIAGWLALRSRRLAPPAGREWWDASRQPGASQLDPASRQPESRFGVSEIAQPSRHGTLSPGLAPPAVEPESARRGLDSLYAPPTLPAPASLRPPPMPEREEEVNRAMSVDEQIDLEQQADFFIALGHEDAAIDLLMAHLRSTGGGTPLPFLKLLEIHRRRDDREAYERTRVRFNQRFNSVAPDWDTDPKAGRPLEDYPLTIGRVQNAWRSPLDAMAELEALLFRRGTGAEMFDLPAYQEVLFLYSLARDLHNAEKPADAGEAVDVLLPIGGAVGAAAAAAPEGTITLRPEFNHGEALSLDLDLSAEPSVGEPIDEPPIEIDLDASEPIVEPPIEIDLDASEPIDEPPIESDLDASEPSQSAEDVWGVTGNKRKDI